MLTRRFSAIVSRRTSSHPRLFTTTPRTRTTLNSETISRITEKEKEIIGQDNPVQGGPTAQAQRHVGETINSRTLHDITEGEKKITGGERIKGGPTSEAQSMLAKGNQNSNARSANVNRANTGGATTTNSRAGGATTANSTASATSSGILDSATISKITDAEKAITGSENPVTGGPTAQAQKHTGEPITSQALHDITEGEKKITGEDRAIKRGPTAAAQSELSKSRQ